MVNSNLHTTLAFWVNSGITPFILYSEPSEPFSFNYPLEDFHLFGINFKLIGIGNLSVFGGAGFYQRKLHKSWSDSTTYSGINSILLAEYEAIPEIFSVNFSWIYGKDFDALGLGLNFQSLDFLVLTLPIAFAWVLFYLMSSMMS